MTLKLKTKLVHEVYYADLNDFISEQYDGRPYNVALALESSNDTQHLVTVHPERPSKWDQPSIDEWLAVVLEPDSPNSYFNKSYDTAEGLSPSPHVLLNDLCASGLLEAGEYLIDVSW